MKRNWILPLLCGLLLGLLVSMAPRLLSRSAEPQGSALLREFSLTDLTSKLGNNQWEILEDKRYKPLPTSSRSKGTARRIIARADMSPDEVSRFTTQFPSAATTVLATYNAMQKGQSDLTQAKTRVINGSPVTDHLDLSHRYYAISDTEGVADLWYVQTPGGVTVIISFTEGL